MTCNKLIYGHANPTPDAVQKALAHATGTTLGDYVALHDQGRGLIHGWFQRAWDARDCTAENSFEPFIFAWIAFNGWAACVTKLDADGLMVRALSMKPELSQTFTDMLGDAYSTFGVYAREFHEIWPIFKAAEIRRANLQPDPNQTREQRIAFYLQNGISEFSPRCAEYHKRRHETVPLDWAHSLAAIYRVRCNLFHGEKARNVDNDQFVVHRAFRVLIYLMERRGI